MVSMLLGIAGVKAAGRAQAALSSAPVCTSAVSADYLYFHSLVSPHAPLSDPRHGSAACPARKGIRT